MRAEDDDQSTYLDEVAKESPLLFASSGSVLTIEDPNLHPCLLYTSPSPRDDL